MGEARGLEEPDEGADVARQAFEPHLLLEVERGVRREDVRRPAAGADERQQAVPQGLPQVECGELCGGERVEAPDERPAGEDVEAPATQLPHARPRQDEAPAVGRLEDLADDREEVRDPLDLVEDDRVATRLAVNEVSEPLRPGRQLPFDLGAEQVDVESPGQDVPEPGRLPRPARPEKEEALPRRLEEP